MQDQEKTKAEVEDNAEESRPLDQSEMEQIVGGGGDSESLEATPADSLGHLDHRELRRQAIESLEEQQGS